MWMASSDIKKYVRYLIKILVSYLHTALVYCIAICVNVHFTVT